MNDEKILKYNTPSYELDITKINTIEDIKIILGSLRLSFTDLLIKNSPELIPFLKNYDSENKT